MSGKKKWINLSLYKILKRLHWNLSCHYILSLYLTSWKAKKSDPMMADVMPLWANYNCFSYIWTKLIVIWLQNSVPITFDNALFFALFLWNLFYTKLPLNYWYTHTALIISITNFLTYINLEWLAFCGLDIYLKLVYHCIRHNQLMSMPFTVNTRDTPASWYLIKLSCV